MRIRLLSAIVVGLGLNGLAGPEAAAQSIAGTVFEDVNYGGGAGRPLSGTPGAVPVGRIAGTATVTAGTRVELYTAAGVYVSAVNTSTAAAPALGTYSFGSLTPGLSYQVRVVSSSVRSTRAGGTSGSPRAVLTYAYGATDRVGGADPARAEAPNGGTGTTLTSLDVPSNGATVGTVPLVVATVQIPLGAGPSTVVSGVDFGFNFSTVVNTNAGGQGSLAQFVGNANTLGSEASLQQAGFYRDALAGNASPNVALPAGRETSIFMIPDGQAHPGLQAAASGGPASQLTGGVAVISPTLAYSLTSPNTILDGRTQSYNVGNTNAAALGTGGTVGTLGTALARLDGPEVQLSGPRVSGNGATFVTGLTFGAGADGSGLHGLALVGFNGTPVTSGSATSPGGAVRVSSAGNVTIGQNVLGTAATAFTDPGAAARTSGDNLSVVDATGCTVSQNLIGYAGGVGVNAQRNGTQTTTALTITGNELVSNGRNAGVNGLDNITARGTGTLISGNRVFGAGTGHGIDVYEPTGSATIEDNTISNSGEVTGSTPELGGVRLYGSGAVVRRNVISDNTGSGVLATYVTGNLTSGAVISQNQISGNGFLGIDLVSGPASASSGLKQRQGETPYVSLNDDTDADAGANGLLNFPVLESATVVGTNLVVSGFAPAGSTVEVFVAAPAGSNVSATAGLDTRSFGQGSLFLFAATEGSGQDADGTTGSYSAPVNGFGQGSEVSAPRFSFTVPLSSLPGGGAGLTPVVTRLTATATLSGAGTSEFGGNVLLNAPPVATNAQNTPVLNTSGTVALSPGLSGQAFGPGNGIASYTITALPATGTLLLDDGTTVTPVTAGQTILAAAIGGLRYQVPPGFGGTVTLQFAVSDQNGLSSDQNSTNGLYAAGPATYSIPVLLVSDVATSVTPAPAGPINAGTGLSFAVTFENLGPDQASGLTRTLTLTPGLGTGGNVSITGAGGLTGTYSNANGTVAFNQNPTTLAAGANLNVTVTIGAVPGAITAVTASTTIGTSNSQGSNPGPDAATATVVVTPIADVTTGLTAGTGQTQFLPGGTNSITVTFRNAGPSPAAGATRTVTVPAGFVVAAAPGSTSVSGNTITYPAADPLPASTTSTSYTFQLTAPAPAVATNYTLTSNAATTTSQGSNALTDQATLTLNVIGPGFGCTASVYRVRQPNGSNFSVLERLDRSTVNGVITFTATSLYNLNNNGAGPELAVNALSYNAADGYLYAVGAGSLIRLGQDSYQNLGASGAGVGGNSSGADGAGTIYYADNNDNTLTRLVVATRTVTSVTLSQTVSFGDLAVNPLDGFIYATRYYNPAGNNGLARIDPSNGQVTILAPGGSLTTTGQDVGSLFFDASGTLYAATNQGTLVLFNTADGSVTDIGSITNGVQADAGSCATPLQRLDVVRTAAPPVVVTPATSATSPVTLAVTFTVRVRNTGPVNAPTVQLNDFVSSAFAAGNPTRTISSGPTLVGGAALTPNPGFNGQSDTRLLAGTDVLQPGEEATLTYTLQLTYPNTGAVPQSVINTQSLVSSTAGAGNDGYTQVSGALVPPALVFAVDRSTNSAALPASANADAPSFTPVSFAGTPLPVELLVFEATPAADDAALRWTTAQEHNNAQFEVERSVDGRQFERVGSVQGAGNSTSARHYGFRDVQARRFGALLYYRLRQVDHDGTAAYLPVRVVRFGSAQSAVSVSPNPARSHCVLDLQAVPAGKHDVQLHDLSGRALRRWTLAGAQKHRLELTGLPAGVYLIQIEGQAKRLRVVKE